MYQLMVGGEVSGYVFVSLGVIDVRAAVGGRRSAVGGRRWRLVSFVGGGWAVFVVVGGANGMTMLVSESDRATAG